MPFRLAKTDLPHPLPRGFEYHKHRSLIALPPPLTPIEQLTYQKKRVRRYLSHQTPYDAAVVKWQDQRSKSLAMLETDSTPRPGGARTIIYGRVSQSVRMNSHGEIVDSTSLDTNDAVAEKWYELHREYKRLPPLERERTFHDRDVSRRSTFATRPAGYELLHYVRRGDHIIFPAVDRLGCSIEDTASTLSYLFRRGVTVHLIGFPMSETYNPGDPMAQFMLAVLAWSSHIEWQFNSTRRKNATSSAKAAGKWTGTEAPFGFRYDLDAWGERKKGTDGKPVIVENQEEKEMLAEAYRVWKDDGWSVYEIKLALANLGVKRNGKPWREAQLYAAIQQIVDEHKRMGVV